MTAVTQVRPPFLCTKTSKRERRVKQGSRGHLWTVKEWVDEVFSPHHGIGVCTTHWHTLHITPLNLWVINHKNATACVNVTGSIRVKPGFKPGFEPGSRCQCERGESPIALGRVHTQSSYTSGVHGNPISAMYQNFSVIRRCQSHDSASCRLSLPSRGNQKRGFVSKP